jgi:IS30 family transposase
MNNANFKQILDTLPEKPPRSRLEPYRALIEKLRKHGRTYREIIGILSEKCGVQVAASTLHDFVRVQLRERSTQKRRDMRAAINKSNRPSAVEKMNPITTTSDEVQERILALKRRCATSTQPAEKPFHYDPDEPLHLPADIREK